MPYILQARRKLIDPYIIESISNLSNAQRVDVSVYYKKLFIALARDVYSLMTSNIVVEGPSKLAQSIVAAGGKDAVYGNLHYALAKLVMETPKKLVEGGHIEKEYSYATHAFTVGALYKASLVVSSSFPDDGVSSTILGVYLDAILEYKRRLNVPYEEEKVFENGDVYPVRDVQVSVFERTTIDLMNGMSARIGKLEKKANSKRRKKKSVDGSTGGPKDSKEEV